MATRLQHKGVALAGVTLKVPAAAACSSVSCACGCAMAAAQPSSTEGLPSELHAHT